MKTTTRGKFVVLLRGVNVGKGNRIQMAQFKHGLETLGYTEVVTILNSGNALFSSSTKAVTKHLKAISQLLNEEFHISTPVIVLPASLFAAIAELGKTIPPTKLPDRFAVAQHAAYLYCPDGVLQSETATALLGKAGRNVTTRNWATVLNLHKLMAKT